MLSSLRMNRARGYVECCKKVQCDMSFIGTLEPANDFTTAGTNIASRPLNAWILGFSSTENTSACLVGAQVEPNNIGSFWGKLWVGANAPAPLPGQENILLAKYAPHGIVQCAKELRDHWAVPAGFTGRCGSSRVFKTLARKSSSNFGGLPERGRSYNPAIPWAEKRFRQSIIVFGWTFKVDSNFTDGFSIKKLTHHFGSFY